MQKDSAMRLLIVDDRVEDAEAIVSALRNGGIAVRPLRPQNTAELEHMVASQPVDLVLAAASVAEQKRIEASDQLPFEDYRREYTSPERLGTGARAVLAGAESV